MQFKAQVLATIALSLRLVSAFTGDATFYDPSGLGSCGDVLNVSTIIY